MHGTNVKKNVWMFWWAEELLFSEAAVCYIELWKNVESSAEVKGPMNEWMSRLRVQALTLSLLMLYIYIYIYIYIYGAPSKARKF